jgi:Peptidase A4 family
MLKRRLLPLHLLVRCPCSMWYRLIFRAFMRPPEGFDPLTASPEELESWGYPPRPRVTEGSRALAHWLEETNPALRREVPDLVRTPGVYHRAVKGLVIKSSTKSNAVLATSGNWSGFALVPASGAQPFYHVTAHWTVPTVRQAPGTCSGGWDYSSQWVGIGGFNDSFLLQAGSAANVFCGWISAGRLALAIRDDWQEIGGLEAIHSLDASAGEDAVPSTSLTARPPKRPRTLCLRLACLWTLRSNDKLASFVRLSGSSSAVERQLPKLSRLAGVSEARACWRNPERFCEGPRV